jgi:two-component SAPR family response regulator
LREVLPEAADLSFEGDRLRFGGQVALHSDSTEFESLVTMAARLQGVDRVARLRQALAIVAAGEYLPGVDTEWARQRREQLRERAADAALEAAQLAFAAGHYPEAEELAESALAEDAFRESAWRLIMRIAAMTGDEDRVIGAYRRCQQVLGHVGAEPSRSTQQLLAALRR